MTFSFKHKWSGFALLFLLPLFAFTQNCLPEGIVFSNQNQIDNFTANFPGCTSIDGDVMIKEAVAGDIIDLTGLAVLQTIGGDLSIKSNANLLNLDGLSGIGFTGGSLIISSNASLKNLTALGNLNSIGGNITIIDNPALTTIAGLSNLFFTGGNLTVGNNDMLPALSGLENLFSIPGNLYIYGNELFTNLSGLNNILSIGGDMHIESNPAIEDFAGLEDLSQINGNLLINDNGSLQKPQGLGNLQSITGNCIIDNNSVFDSFDGLGNLMTIGGHFDFTNNPALSTFLGLNNLMSIGSFLKIENNSGLETLNGLGNIAMIGGDLSIIDNSELSSLEGLINCMAINGELSVINNDDLNALTGLDNIDPASITNLIFQNSGTLSFCNVASICDYLDDPDHPATISGNNPLGNCNSRLDIYWSCLTPCLPDGIEITTQAEIDDFAANYPGCELIDGTLDITEGEDEIIDNLEGLAQIKAVDGIMNLHSLPHVNDLEGLENLAFANSIFAIQSTSISHVDELSNLQTAGSILLNFNDLLTNVDGFHRISDLAVLKIEECPILSNLNGFQNLTLITNRLEIDDADALLNLDPLANLDSINYIEIVGNNSLTSIAGLAGIDSGLSSDLRITSNTNLTSLFGLHNIPTVGGNVKIRSNRELTDINLSSLTTISLDLEILYNDMLQTLSGLDNLESVGRHMLIIDNDGLVNLNGLEHLNSSGGNTVIEFNDILADISALSNLETINGQLQIKSPQLSSLDGLEGLTHVSQGLYIEDNTILEQIDALSNLTFIGSSLIFYDNPILTDISGLQQIDPQTLSSVQFRGNEALSVCHITPICTYLSDAANASIIELNAENCNSRAEVEDECSAILPVEWGKPLSAKKTGSDALLKWSVTELFSSRGFSIEFSTNGQQFNSIGWINTNDIHTEKHFEFVHQNPPVGLNYYRIKQVDIEETYSYSNIVTLNFDNKNTYSAYPNPVSGQLFIQGKNLERATVEITNSMGQIIHTKLWSPAGIHFADYPLGLYYISIQTASKTTSLTVIKNR